MDPFSITLGAAALLKIVWHAVHEVKKTIETVKNAKKLLMNLLNQTERMRLLLEQLRSLTFQLQGRSTLLLPFNDSACKETVKDLQALVHEIVKTTTFLNLQVLLNKSKADELLKRLRRHEDEIVIVLLCIVTETSLKTEGEVKLMTDKALSQSQLVSLWDAFSVSGPSEEATSQGDFHKYLAWPGYVVRSQFDQKYLSLRDQLADAAYYWQSDAVFDALKAAKEKYNQPWVNFPRLSQDPTKNAGWTPLHQAVFMCASENEIYKLLELGGLRTLRTVWSPDFSHHDMTPIEMARALGYSHLYKILTPVIRHNVPAKTIEALQARFHEIIKTDLVEGRYLRFPELVVLTELEVPAMWFPLTPPGAAEVKGYLYRLDGRELVVISYGLDARHGSTGYRISIDNTTEVADPVLFDTS